MQRLVALLLPALLLTGCGDDEGAAGDGPVVDDVCSGQRGEHHDQLLQVGELTRYYFLYVPDRYDCEAQAWPLLVDFHGTSGGAEPELSYKTEELLALADAEQVIVARPRSRSSAIEGAGEIFRWDQNPGDLERNVDFAHELVADLSSRYHIDPARVYASGFSSGSNMTAQFLADEPRVFAGLGLVAGGLWSSVTIGADPPDRIYDATGYRDYLWPSVGVLWDELDAVGYPYESRFLHESDMGHELYGWHFQELWWWLAEHQERELSPIRPGWARDEGFSDYHDSLTELARAADGGLVATGADGRLYRRETTGAWSLAGTITGGQALVGVCLLPSGRGIAVGHQQVAYSDDHGKTWTAGAPPKGLDPSGFDPAYLNGVGCSAAGRVSGGGYWAALTSANGGTTWSAASMDLGGYSAQAASVTVSAGGTWLATGYYDYLGRSTDGVTFTKITSPEAHEWWTDAAVSGSTWIVVGEAGTILRSTDDGQHFTRVTTPPTYSDLYAVAFADDGQTALAVGDSGAALLSRDAGLTWSNVLAGGGGFLGGVEFLDDTHALVVGEYGMALVFTIPAES